MTLSNGGAQAQRGEEDGLTLEAITLKTQVAISSTRLDTDSLVCLN